jgi:hypothetical protein
LRHTNHLTVPSFFMFEYILVVSSVCNTQAFGE